ncbi:hypothetical protein [Aureimonas jatrophae]|jgi:hypothetical protein|uniref:Transmembrane protein (PGPGW) n=1 Tax=Aureimonas jatrophae TaxID=1166073 RepID=A0A1H0GVE5_9HYPH|nr:hypothetical protein [Aureimonas jatrophae]SDO10819.1 hypothetical protein SAMN05192530_103362 [Aureimonas jatrophae]
MTEPTKTGGFFRVRGHTLEVMGRTFRLPSNRLARMAVGVLFVLGGIFSFLPVLGIWMLPLGLVILSIDIPAVRRMRRRSEVKWGRRRQRQRAMAATLPHRPRKFLRFRVPRFLSR